MKINNKVINIIKNKSKGKIQPTDVFRAYYDCRTNKRNTLEALDYELNFERNNLELCKRINNGNYKIDPLKVFIVNKPVKREIFAACFKDRVVHHLVINKVNFLFEKEFIYDSYSCRVGKGTHFGVKRVNKFLRRATDNYQKKAWILKLDIKGYFMHINKLILLKKVKKFLNENYSQSDKKITIRLFETLIKNDPTKNCVRKSPKEKWKGLPRRKSLFFSPENCGLPVGNYTNQVLANFYLNELDHFIKSKLKMKNYGRYVDDLLIVSRDKRKLKKVILKIKDFLEKKLKLELHPKKIYFQPACRGVEYLGVIIKPYRCYISSRVKNNFLRKIASINKKLTKGELTDECKKKIISQINSYLGMLKHYNTYNLRKKFFNNLNKDFWDHFEVNDDLTKIENS